LLIDRIKEEKLFDIKILRKLSQNGINIENYNSTKKIISTQDTYNIARVFENSKA
jgi:phage repressor protein C with HTH and peptisase S24 domain